MIYFIAGTILGLLIAVGLAIYLLEDMSRNMDKYNKRKQRRQRKQMKKEANPL